MNYEWFFSRETQYYRLPEPILLESKVALTDVQVAYRSWGQLNATGDNAILICHALTGSADADSWWEPLFGVGKTFDRDRDFIVCTNILGSCYGTTGPISIHPKTGRSYGAEFPPITIRDMVRVQAALVKGLGIRKLKMVIGGSLGGMQVLEWALMYPELVQSMVVIAASGRHSAWCIGVSETQRQAIYADPNWRNGYYSEDKPPIAGLAAARMVAMCAYRSHQSFQERFGRRVQENGELAIASYLHHQGAKLVDRFDANTYIGLTKAMDSHDVGRERGNYEAILASITVPTLIVSIDTDILYPPIEQQELAAFIPNSQLGYLNSLHGHDAFLIDMVELDNLVVNFLSKQFELKQKIDLTHRNFCCK